MYITISWKSTPNKIEKKICVIQYMVSEQNKHNQGRS